MTKLNINSKKGFTIIEVVLVLAIAGLIFLMVFIALPNLQRTQRDTQRRNDVDRVSSALIQYVANNNKLPSTSTNNVSTVSYVVGSDVSSTSTGAWAKFYWNYLLANGDDSFEDASGGNYNLVATNCEKGNTTVNIDGIDRNTCTSNILSMTNTASPLNADFDIAANTSLAGYESIYTIVVASNAMCGNEEDSAIVYTEGTRKFAVALRLEGTGIYCVNN